MTKKLKILILLVFIPNILSIIYDRLFRYSANWLEDYQNYFKLSLVILSIIGTIWLVFISKKEKSYGWFWATLSLLIILIIYLYFAVAVINSSY